MYSCLSGALYMNLVVTAYKGRNMSNYIGYYTICIYVLLLLSRPLLYLIWIQMSR